MIGRYVRVCAFTGLLCASPAIVHATRIPGGGSSTVLLRYHFVAGQRLAYRVTTTGRLIPRLSNQANLGAGLANAQIHVIAEDYVVEIRVMKVDAAGTATVVETTHRLTSTSGRSHTQTAPAPVQAAETITVTITPDGTQHRVGPTTNSGSLIPLRTIGTLPPVPVARGAHWASESVMPGSMGMPTLHVTIQNILVGFGQAEGEPVAIISTTERTYDEGVAKVPFGLTLYFQESESAAEQTLFDVTSGQLVTSQRQTDFQTTIRYRQANEKGRTARTDIIERTVIQRLRA